MINHDQHLEIAVDDHGFKLFKKLKPWSHGFRLKVKTVIGNYGFRHYFETHITIGFFFDNLIKRPFENPISEI